MIDDRTMGDLRMAATLVHALPGIVLRVDGGPGLAPGAATAWSTPTTR